MTCLVKGCHRPSSSDEFISYFGLPKDEVMRQEWLNRIGEARNSSKPRWGYPTICNAHFSADAYVVPEAAIIKYSDRNKFKGMRRLLPHAVPTLNLNPKERNGPRTSTAGESTIPQRSQQLVTTRKLQLIGNGKRAESAKPDETRRGSKRGKKRDRQDHSEDESLLSERARRLMMEHADNNSTDPQQNLKTEEFAKMMTELIKRLKYTEGLIHFYQNSACDDQREISQLKARCATYAAQMKEEQAAKDKLFAEVKKLRELNERLHTESTSPKANVKNLSETQQDTFASILEPYLTEELNEGELNERLHTESTSPKSNMKHLSETQQDTFASILKPYLTEGLNEGELNERLHTESTSPKANVKHLSETQQDTFASILKPYLTEGQIRCIIEGRKQITWSIDDFAAAISLRSVSPKAYRYLRNKLNLPLPSLLSLRQWALVRFDTSEGFLKDVLTVMREKGKTLSEMERVAVITFAEMSLTHEICFDSKLQQMIGPCTKVLVIMVRGLFGNWKQPIYYKFDQRMTKTILNEAITLLSSADYQVVAVTCDIGNEQAWSELGITVEKSFIPHPVKTDQIIYAFADVPHLLKLIRNWYMDDGFLLQGCTEPLTRTVLQTIVDKSTDLSDFPIAHKLTQRVIDARIDLTQAVWPAARIWSRSMAKSVEWISRRNLLNSRDYRKYSDFILAVNNWFDIHNSSMQYGKHGGVNAYGVDEDNQEMRLALMTSHMESMRVGSRTKLMPFQEGVMISNASLRGLHGYLKEKFPNDYEYIITRRLQQDVLENFFTDIRAMGTTGKLPSAYEFRCRLRWYLLGVYSHAILDDNPDCEEDMGVYCISSSHSTASTLKERPDILQPLELHNSGSNEADHINALESSSSSSITSVVFQSHNTLEPEYEYEPDSDAEILLTEELFLEIMNMSPFLATAEIENNCSMDNFEDNLHELDEIDEVQKLGSVLEKSTLKDCSAMIADRELMYVAAYVAYRFRNKYRYLGQPSHFLENSTSNELLDWIQTVSRGHFQYPSRELLHAAKIVEECFTNFHRPEFSMEDKVIEKVVLLAKSKKEYPDGIPDEVLQCLVRTRTYIRIKEINKKMFAKRMEVQN